MPRFEITGPDGHKYEVTAPEGATEQDVLAHVRQQVESQSAVTGDTTKNTVGGLPLQSMSGHQFSTGHVGEVASEGFRDAPKLIPQEAIDQAERSGVAGYYLTAPILKATNLPLQLGNALFRGGQQFAQEALSPISPQLGREVAAYPESRFGSPRLPPGEVPRIPRPRELTPLLNDLTPAPVVTPAIRQAAEAHTARMAEPVTLERLTDAVRRADEEGGRPTRGPDTAPPEPEIPTVTVTGRREPEPVGAQITTEPIPEQTKTQAQTNFEKDVRQTAEERAGPQMVDHTPYLEGAERTEAAREFSEEASAHEKAIGDADPEFKTRTRQKEDEGKKIAEDKYNELAQDKNAVDAAVEERSKFSPDQLGVFEKEAPTEQGQNIVDYFNRLLATRQGKRSAVRSILEDARDAFLDADGNPEVLPSRLYGARQNLTDILNEGLGSSTSTRKGSVQAARHFLTEALDEHVDPAINSGAPLFDTFLTKWHELSKPIDRMEFLQEHKFGPGSIYGTDGKVQFGSIQKLLEKMVKLQNSGGNNAAKSFEPEHLAVLVAIRNELAAWHLRDRMGKVAGSDTNQRAQAAATLKAGPLGKAIGYAAEAAAQTAALATAPGWGNIVALGARPLIKKGIESRAAKRLERLKKRMLETAPPNDLMP